jgi:hypothetical protein
LTALRAWQEIFIFLFSKAPKLVLGPTCTIQWVLGSSSLWVKQVGQEADLSPSFTAELPNLISSICFLRDHLNGASTRDELGQLIEVIVTAV